MAAKRHKAIVLLQTSEDKESVLKKLRAAGFDVEEHLDAIGAVSGSAPAGKLDKLRSIKGVKAVQVEQSYQLPPPDSPVQ